MQSIDKKQPATITRMKRFNQHDSEDMVKTKPPMVPMKRKKKFNDTNTETIVTEKAQPTDSQKSKLKAKRQKIENDNSKITQMVPISEAIKRITSKPPIPPKPDALFMTQIMNVKQSKNKNKLEETNVVVVQKLNALADKLRLENADLMKALSNEKLAVRKLRYFI